MPGTLKDKVAIVTGAAGGFGRVLVHAFLGAGAKVLAMDVDQKGLATLASSLPGAGARLRIEVGDIAQYAACERAAGIAREDLGGLHVLINNAAMSMTIIREDCMKTGVDIREISPEMWQRFVAVNFSGAWNMTRACIDHMVEQQWGRIINVTTSFYTMLRAGFQPYGPCKAAMEAMSAAHAKEFGGTGVTVNVVVPGGPADTPMIPQGSGFNRKDLISPDTMAPPILFLCSEGARGITGNRYVAAKWNANTSPVEMEQACRAPIAWPDLAQSPVWPGGRPPG